LPSALADGQKAKKNRGFSPESKAGKEEQTKKSLPAASADFAAEFSRLCQRL